MDYISNLNISFSLTVAGHDHRFCFDSMTNGGSRYSTNNPDEIKALESSDLYHKWYERDPRFVSEEAEKKVAKKSAKKLKVKVVEGVATFQDAKEYLVKHCKADESALTSPESIAAKASAENISFPNL